MESPFFDPDAQWDDQWQPADPGSFDWDGYYQAQSDLGNPSTIIFPEIVKTQESAPTPEDPKIYIRKYTLEEFDNFKKEYPQGFILLPIKSSGIIRRKRIEQIEMALLLDN